MRKTVPSMWVGPLPAYVVRGLLGWQVGCLGWTCARLHGNLEDLQEDPLALNWTLTISTVQPTPQDGPSTTTLVKFTDGVHPDDKATGEERIIIVSTSTIKKGKRTLG